MHVNLLSCQSERGSGPRNGASEQRNGAGQQGSTYSICDDYYGCFDLRSHVMHDKDIVIVIFIHHQFLFSPSPQKTLHTEALLVSMDSFSRLNSVYHNTSSINDMDMTPDLSLILDDTSFVSQSPTTPLHNRLLSAGDFSHGSKNIARTLDGSLSYESSTYRSNLHDRCQHLECELSYEKEEHKKLRKVPRFLVSQPNN